jgi:DNA primase
MPGSTWADFKKVKASVTIEAVLKRYGLLEGFDRKGDRLSGPCPVHKGSNRKQFSVSVAKGAWKCFSGHCGKQGNVIDLVAAIENVPFRDAAVLMQGWFGIEPDQPATSRTPMKAVEKEKAPPTPPSTAADTPAPFVAAAAKPVEENRPLSFELKLEAEHPYLKSRGLTAETIANFGLGYSSRGSMKDRIAIPLHNEKGELVAYAGRWAGTDSEIPASEGKYKLPAGFHKSQIVFNLHRIPPATKTVVLVEGFFSVFWLHQNGWPNTVAVMGSSFSPWQIQLLAERFKGIMVFLDGDEAGQEAALKVTLDFARHTWVKIIACPEGLQPDRLPLSDLKMLLQ